MLPTTTRIAVVVPALVDLIGEATGWATLDGPLVGQGDQPRDMVLVGLQDGPEAPGYTSTRLPESGGLAADRWQEDWTVRCFLSSWRGDEDLAARRDACAGALGAIEQALAAAGYRDGVWDRVQLGLDADWVPVQSDVGAACGVVFSVTGSGLL